MASHRAARRALIARQERHALGIPRSARARRTARRTATRQAFVAASIAERI